MRNVMFAGFRGKVLAVLFLLVPVVVVLCGIFQVSQAGMVGEDYENHRLSAQLMRVEPRPETAVHQQEKVTTPAVRQPAVRTTREPVTVEEEEDVSQDKKESAPLIQRFDGEATKKEPATTSRPPAKPLPKAGIDPPSRVQTPHPALPAQSAPPAAPPRGMRQQPVQPALPAQPAPPAASPSTTRQQPLQLEHSQPPEGLTSPAFEQKADSPAADRPWYQRSTQPEGHKPVGEPVLRETRPPALPSRPASGVMTPPPALKQPRFGVPLHGEEGAAIDKPMDHRPVQQDVLSPRQQELTGVSEVDLCPCTMGEGDYPIPRVTNYDVRGGVSKGGKITFSGTNFLADRIMVCIGDIQLHKVTASANQLVVQAPQDLIAGALMISHGTSDSNYVLEDNFRIIGDPVITSIHPTSFRPGDQVTVRGADLFLYPLTMNYQGSTITSRFLKISNDPLHYGEGSFIRVTNYRHSSDMSEITFLVSEVFSHQITYVVDGVRSDHPSYFGQRIQQPEVLAGPLRFNPAGSDRFDFAGPNVTWQRDADEFLLSAIKPPAWGSEQPMFVIASGDNPRGGTEVWFEGTGLDGARFKVGDQEVTGGASAHGRDGFFVVKPSTHSGTVSATKSGITVSYPEPLTVIPEPAFLPGTLPTAPYVISVDEVHELRGWDLFPPNVPGLAYRFDLSGLNEASSSSCKIALQVINHSASTLRFKVVSTEPVPDSCLPTTLFGGTGQTFYKMRLIAEYGGVQRELWSMPYRLAR